MFGQGRHRARHAPGGALRPIRSCRQKGRRSRPLLGGAPGLQQRLRPSWARKGGSGEAAETPAPRAPPSPVGSGAPPSKPPGLRPPPARPPARTHSRSAAGLRPSRRIPLEQPWARGGGGSLAGAERRERNAARAFGGRRQEDEGEAAGRLRPWVLAQGGRGRGGNERNGSAPG